MLHKVTLIAGEGIGPEVAPPLAASSTPLASRSTGKNFARARRATEAASSVNQVPSTPYAAIASRSRDRPALPLPERSQRKVALRNTGPDANLRPVRIYRRQVRLQNSTSSWSPKTLKTLLRLEHKWFRASSKALKIITDAFHAHRPIRFLNRQRSVARRFTPSTKPIL